MGGSARRVYPVSGFGTRLREVTQAGDRQRAPDWTRRGGGLARSTFLELFFDLVFVLAPTQLSSSLVDHLNWSGA